MSIIKLTDSYKFSHFNQYPEGTEIVHSYMSSRGGEYDEMVFFGLKYYLDKYLSEEVTRNDVYEAEACAFDHGVPFNKAGWRKLINKYGGNLKEVIQIKAIPEGLTFKPHEVILTIENTDPDFFWLVSWLETLLMKVWYPTTIASKSFHVKKMLEKYARETID